MIRSKQHAPEGMARRYHEMMQTVWRSAGAFMDEFYSAAPLGEESEVACFKALFAKIGKR